MNIQPTIKLCGRVSIPYTITQQSLANTEDRLKTRSPLGAQGRISTSQFSKRRKSRTISSTAGEEIADCLIANGNHLHPKHSRKHRARIANSSSISLSVQSLNRASSSTVSFLRSVWALPLFVSADWWRLKRLIFDRC